MGKEKIFKNVGCKKVQFSYNGVKLSLNANRWRPCDQSAPGRVCNWKKLETKMKVIS